MTKIKLIALASAIFASLITVSACAGIISHDETLRYKMTVTISTPDGDKVGSAVKEAVKQTEKSILPEQGGTKYGIKKGEAVLVDLGPRGIIFALQSREYEAETSFKLFEKSPSFPREITLLPEQYPKFVFFEDLQSPSTVSLAYMVQKYNDVNDKGQFLARKCCHITNNLELLFGKGVAIKSITLEKTTDPVTWNIDRVLPWVHAVKMSLLNGNHITTGPSLYDRLDGSYFQVGNK